MLDLQAPGEIAAASAGVPGLVLGLTNRDIMNLRSLNASADLPPLYKGSGNWRRRSCG